jgi:putative transposase
MSTMVGERLQQPQNVDAYAQGLSIQDLPDRGTGSPVPSDDRMLQARLQPVPGPKKLERERSNPRRLTAFDQIKELTALKCDAEFLREAPHHPLVQSVMDLHKGFKNFFEGRAAFPKFRKKGENASFRYPDAKQIKIEADRISLPKAGWTAMVMHRPIQGAVKNVTVSETAVTAEARLFRAESIHRIFNISRDGRSRLRGFGVQGLGSQRFLQRFSSLVSEIEWRGATDWRLRIVVKPQLK